MYAIQAYGLNEDEIPYSTLSEMAAAHATLVESIATDDGVDVVGYSFGARLAAEVSSQLGAESVCKRVFLAPGSPRLFGLNDRAVKADFADPYFAAIVMSVVTGRLPDLQDRDRWPRSPEGFSNGWQMRRPLWMRKQQPESHASLAPHTRCVHDRRRMSPSRVEGARGISRYKSAARACNNLRELASHIHNDRASSFSTTQEKGIPCFQASQFTPPQAVGNEP